MNPSDVPRAPLLLACILAAILHGTAAGQPQSPPARPRGQRPQVLSLLGQPLYAMPPGPQRLALEAKLAEARAELAREPDDPQRVVWVGRRLGYLWRVPEAIEVYTQGLQMFPDHAPLCRHRGHRYLTARQFEKAEADLERAARLIEGRPQRIEPDGMPNARNIPLTTTASNVWYHLGLARYLQGNFEGAAKAFRKTLEHGRGLDDNIVSASDWLYMSLRRQGAAADARAVLETITSDMEIIENHAYHQRLLMYKGLKSPADLLGKDASDLDRATLGYGIANWHLCEGRPDEARRMFERIVEGPYWPAFGHIAAEADLARMRQESE